MGSSDIKAILAGTPDPASRGNGAGSSAASDLQVAIVDDDESIRIAVQTLVERDGFRAATYATAETFLADLRPELFGCLVLDLHLPGIDGLELQEILNRRSIHIPVIVFTAQGSIPKAVAALKSGAVDFVEKPFDNKDLMARIRGCLEREQQSRARTSVHDSAACRLASLTSREREVMERIVAGRQNKHIADELGICIKTVEFHRSKIMQKIGVHSVAELVQLTLASASHAPAEKQA